MNNIASFPKRGLFMIPYAHLELYQGGVNLSAQKAQQQEIYLKNCCIACLSARKHLDVQDDVALVTNIDIPQPYSALLQEKDVRIIQLPFDMFHFDRTYPWSLAFYKLCALYHLCRESDYAFYAYADSDVYIQQSFAHIWQECTQNILLYDINHGLQTTNYVHFLSEVQAFISERRYITHYGGEFFAANRENAQIFSDVCRKIFQQMQASDFTTTHGDEFILSVAASKLSDQIKNAGAYVHRFWTGAFRLTSTNYAFNPVAVLHVPSEKEHGMLRLFRYYTAKRTLPARKQVWKILHLQSMDFRIAVKTRIKALLRKT